MRLQVDGDLKTGSDIVKAAILGAESFGFGCKYLRICYLNNYDTGVATQDVTLRREHFGSLSEMAMAFFRHMVHEKCFILAEIRVAQLVDLIGHRVTRGSDCPRTSAGLLAAPAGLHWREDNRPADRGEFNRRMEADFAERVRLSLGGADENSSPIPTSA